MKSIKIAVQLCIATLLVGVVFSQNEMSITGSESLRQLAVSKLRNYIHAYNAGSMVTDSKIDKLADYLVTGANAKLPANERTTALKYFFQEMIPIMQIDTTINLGPKIDAENIAAIVMRTNGGNLINAAPLQYRPDNSPGDIQVIGNGGKNIVFISDVGTDADLYLPMIEFLKNDFTCHVVTLPGSALSDPYHLSNEEMAHPEKLAWLSRIEKNLISYIKEKKISTPILVGTMAGGYFATKLALKYPDLIGKAILLNALVNTPMRSTEDVMKKANHQERLRRIKTPLSLFKLYTDLAPHVKPDKDAIMANMDNVLQRNRQVLNNFFYNVKDTGEAKKLFVKSLTTYNFAKVQYLNEFSSTDLTDELQQLKVPVLVIPSVHDEKSPYMGRTALAQWEEIKVLYPKIPLSIEPFYDTRSMAALDDPSTIGMAIKSFAENKKITVKQKVVTSVLPSPRKNATLNISGCHIKINYGSPQVNAREIWGKLVPLGKLWRAGANEATTIHFTKDVLAEGMLLKAGVYSIFAIPETNKWTIIFNKIPDQWANTDYSSSFDALRIEIVPTASDFTESLTYEFTETSGNKTKLRIGWEKINVLVNLQVK